MSTEGHAMHLFRILGTQPPQIVEFLRPFGGLMPTTEAQFLQLQTVMRRTLRISEHTPGNIGEYLHHNSPTRTNTYYGVPGADQSGQYYWGNSTPEDAPWTQVDSQSGGHLFDTPVEAPFGADPGQSTFSPSMAMPAGSQQYLAAQDDPEYDLSATETETSSDDGTVPIDYNDCNGYTHDQIAQYLYGEKSHANQRFRRWTSKPVRRVRRFVKKRVYLIRQRFGKGKGGKGKGKSKG